MEVPRVSLAVDLVPNLNVDVRRRIADADADAVQRLIETSEPERLRTVTRETMDGRHPPRPIVTTG